MSDGGKGSARRPGEGYSEAWDRIFGKKPRIEIYTGPGCPLCEQAKALCRAKGLEFTETPIASDRGMAMMEHYPMVRQMPQIFINGQRVGGLAGLQAALKQVGL